MMMKKKKSEKNCSPLTPSTPTPTPTSTTSPVLFFWNISKSWKCEIIALLLNKQLSSFNYHYNNTQNDTSAKKEDDDHHDHLKEGEVYVTIEQHQRRQQHPTTTGTTTGTRRRDGVLCHSRGNVSRSTGTQCTFYNGELVAMERKVAQVEEGTKARHVGNG